MQKGDHSNPDHDINQKRRRSQSKYNKDLPRYQCFCSKQYLSYPALYLHMKNKHLDYFQTNKNGKKVQPTKLIESFNPTEGYKVYKIALDSSVNQGDKFGKYYQNNNYLLNQQGNYIQFPNMAFPPFNGYMMSTNDHKKMQLRQSFIQLALSNYLQTLTEKPAKHKYEVQLFFILLVDCLNKNYNQLQDTRTQGIQVKRYTAEYNSQKIMNILPLFQSNYLPKVIQQSHSIDSFVKRSHIMTSRNYRAVLQQFFDFIYNEKIKIPNPIIHNPSARENNLSKPKQEVEFADGQQGSLEQSDFDEDEVNGEEQS